MPVQTEWPWAPRTARQRPVSRAFVDHSLSVVNQPQVEAATRAAMETSRNPLRVRELAIEHAGLTAGTGAVARSLAGRIEPYLADHPELPAALLHGVYDEAGRVSLTDADVTAQATGVFEQVAPLLYEGKIRRLSRITNPDELRHLRERMQAEGVAFDDPDFRAKLDELTGAVPAGVTVTQAEPFTPQTDGDTQCDDPLPDLTGCGGEPSPPNIRAVGTALYQREVVNYGLREALANLTAQFEAGQIDLCDAGSLVYGYAIDPMRAHDAEFDRIAERPFADGSIEQMMTSVISAALAMDQAERHEQTGREAIFLSAVGDLRCAANEAGCGVPALAADAMEAQLSQALSIVGNEEVESAVRGASCCGRSPLAVIEALTPGRARPPRDQVAARATIGRNLLNAVADEPQDPTDKAWRAGIVLQAYRWAAALQSAQPRSAQVRELPRASGARPARNGTGIVRLRTRA